MNDQETRHHLLVVLPYDCHLNIESQQQLLLYNDQHPDTLKSKYWDSELMLAIFAVYYPWCKIDFTSKHYYEVKDKAISF